MTRGSSIAEYYGESRDGTVAGTCHGSALEDHKAGAWDNSANVETKKGFYDSTVWHSLQLFAGGCCVGMTSCFLLRTAKLPKSKETKSESGFIYEDEPLESNSPA
eukprot:GEMP01089732.1.p1 GENE.GEMP01089732.1~~GEMP01089732.1.p1  ORF type:complete len:105 (+),score=13.44 GEMP01089732.1:190-504(+)